MGNLVLLGMLIITAILALHLYNNPDRIVPLCILYYFVSTMNDIFNGGRALRLAYGFGVSYELSDMLIMLLLIMTILDLAKTKIIKKNLINLLTFTIIMLLFFNAVLGASSFGFDASWIGDLRSQFGFVVPIVCFTRMFKIDYLIKYEKLLDICMWTILSISIVLWSIDIVFGIHPLFSQYNATLSDGGSTMRFIQSYNVLGIALYDLYIVRKDILEKRIIGMRALVFALAVILFQHRSVWLGYSIGFAYVIITQTRGKRVSLKLMSQLIGLICLSSIIIFASSGNITSNVINSIGVFGNLISGGSLEHTTANTRVQVWNAVVEDLNGSAFLIGRPFGYGYARSIGWTTSPHNGYIRILGRSGIIGILVLVLLYVGTIFRYSIKKLPYGAELLLCICGFMYGYDGTWLAGAVLGGSIAIYSQINYNCKTS